ncbi:MAG TPA: hypothetical protein VJV74_10665, partial [Terriglobia bacterium]|nr:hypothetical protein [Terriglobia bacterium]
TGLALALAAIGPTAHGQTASPANYPSTAQSRSSAQGSSEQSGALNTKPVDVAEGTKVSAALVSSVDARTAKPGDQVVARVSKNVKEHGRTVIKKGDELVGHVTQVQAAGAANAGSSLNVTFDRLVQGGTTSQLNAVINSIVSTPSEQRAEQQQMAQSEAPLPAGGPVMARGGGGGGVLGSGRASSGGGGLLGGVGSTVNSTVNAAGSATGSVANGTVGSTVNSATGAAASATGNVAGTAAGTLNANGRGGLSNATSALIATPRHAIHLDTQAAGSQQTGASSVLSTRKGDLALEQGTQVQFRVVGSADAK